MDPLSRTHRTIPAVWTAAMALLAAGPAFAETVEVLWTANPSVGGTTIELQVGDTIEWDVQLGHDLSEMPSQALFDACDFTGSTLIAIGPAVTQTTFDSTGVRYFACSVGAGFHCDLLNMNVTVVVSVGRQNISDKQRSSLRDGFWYRPKPLSGPGTPSFFVPSFFA